MRGKKGDPITGLKARPTKHKTSVIQEKYKSPSMHMSHSKWAENTDIQRPKEDDEYMNTER